MRNFTAISVYLATLMAGAAHAAAPVTVSAGEHESYSRIVVTGSLGSVNVNEQARTVDIRVDTNAELDLSDINDKQKAHRVVAARKVSTPDGAAIQLTLSCDCFVALSRAPNNKLIVDISDAAREPATVKTETELADSDASLEEARLRMIDLLRRAASDGIISIRDDSRDLAPPAQSETASAQPHSDGEATGERDGAQRANNSQPVESVARQCLEDDAFAIDGEPFEADPLIAISELQGEITDAADDRQAEIAGKLADGFLSIAFGEEALELFKDYGQDQTIKADLARVIAERNPPSTGMLMGAKDCNGAHALWQAAASEPESARATLKRAGEAANTLPPRLRAFIATRLAKKMILAEEWSEARKYYVLAGDASATPTSDLQFIAAKLLEQEGRVSDAQSMLIELSAGDTEASKDALLALAARYAAGEEPHDGFMEDIGALAKTDRGSKIGEDAAFREAIAWAEKGNIEASILLLRNAADSAADDAGAVSEAAREMLAHALASPVVKNRIAALAAYLEHRDFVENGGEASFRRAVAGVALELGLPNVALKVLASEKPSGDRKNALVIARAALASEDGETALATAAPFADDPEFGAIVVEANLRLERDHAALAAAATLSDPDEKSAMTARAAWRAGEWASAAGAYQKTEPQSLNEKTAMQYALAAYMAGERAMPPAAEAVLKRDESASYKGLKAFFTPHPDGPIIDRGKAIADGVSDEITLIEEILGDG